MRILHVLEATLGGTRRYLDDVMSANLDAEMGLVYSLDRADVQFADFLERARHAGWHLFEIPMHRSVGSRDVPAALALRGVMSRFEPDVVHAHSSKAGALARLVGLTVRPRPSVVYSPHAISSHLGLAYRLIEKILAPLTSRFVAVSESERDQLIGLGLAPRSRIDVAAPVIDGEHFAPRDREAAKRELGLEGMLVLVAIGRLTQQKNPLQFFSIARALRGNHDNVRAIWVGDGDMRPALESLIDENDALDWFELAGWHSDVRDFIAASDIFINASRYESFGYVTAEALAMERAVVASDVMGTRDIMSGDLATLTFPLESVDGALAICSRFVDDRQFAAEMARLGRISVLARFSTEALRRNLTSSYRSAAGRKTGEAYEARSETASR